MANTPLHATRIPDELWLAAKAEAGARGETLATVINRALHRYAHGPNAKASKVGAK